MPLRRLASTPCGARESRSRRWVACCAAATRVAGSTNTCEASQKVVGSYLAPELGLQTCAQKPPKSGLHGPPAPIHRLKVRLEVDHFFCEVGVRQEPKVQVPVLLSVRLRFDRRWLHGLSNSSRNMMQHAAWARWWCPLSGSSRSPPNHATRWRKAAAKYRDLGCSTLRQFSGAYFFAP